MSLRQRIISEIYDDQDHKIVDRKIIIDRGIKKPKEIDDMGYNHKEQIDILQEIQNAFLFTQSSLITSERCDICGSKVIKNGYVPSDFHAVYTDHKLKIPKTICNNKDCEKKNIVNTIHSLFGSNMHPDLVKKQIKTAAEKSFMKSEESLEGEDGRKRTINNQLTIKKTTEKVGKILSTIHQEEPKKGEVEESKELVVQVDGGYVKSNDKNHRNFEVLVSQVYKPEDHIKGGVSKNGIRVSGEIKDKICSASSLKDRGKTIRQMTIAAAQKKGMTKNTDIVALSDGATNCWNTLKALEKHCKSINYILDWYHIKAKFDKLIGSLEDPFAEEIESIKWKIWHGNAEEAISRLSEIYPKLLDTDCADKLHDLLKYLSNNKRYLVNYEERKKSQLAYTSSAIESSIETIINTRHKKKHKAQWSRKGAHTLLQIITSITNKSLNKEWNIAKQHFYKFAA